MKKQFFIFVIVGGIQYFLDSLAFSLLIFVLSTEVSNVLSRMVGAASGYILNGVYTFKKEGKPTFNISGLFRFVLLWLLMTLVSTLSIGIIISGLSGEWLYLVMAKLVVEAFLVVFSFTLQKFFVYR